MQLRAAAGEGVRGGALRLRAIIDGDPCARGEHHAAAGEARADAEVEPLVASTEARVGAQSAAAAQEQTARIGAERVVHAVVLPLVELPVRGVDGTAEAGHALPERHDAVLVEGADELGGGDRRRRRTLQRSGELRERRGSGSAVLRQDPQRRIGGHAREREGHRLGERRGRLGLDHRFRRLGDAGTGPQRARGAARDDRQRIRPARLGGERIEGAQQAREGGRTRTGDEDGVYSGRHDGVSLSGPPPAGGMGRGRVPDFPAEAFSRRGA